ncbi:MAG: hypothetical protein ACTHZD_14755 [Micrococcaceae bacterium]
MISYKERMRLKKIAEAEDAGESFWTDELDDPARQKLVYAIEAAIQYLEEVDRELYATDLWWSFSRKFCLDNGIARTRFDSTRLAMTKDDEVIFSFVEIAGQAMESHEGFSEYVHAVNRALDRHRINYQLAPNGEIIPRDSQQTHADVTLPALHLLHGRPDFAKAESAYMDALRQISDNNPSTAITKAGTALQETFSALGIRESTLGKQIGKARHDPNLLAGRDQQLLDGISNFLNWAAAERNDNSDAHYVTDAVLDDAWLMVHIVGALILRLAGEPREVQSDQ